MWSKIVENNAMSFINNLLTSKKLSKFENVIFETDDDGKTWLSIFGMKKKTASDEFSNGWMEFFTFFLIWKKV